MMIEEEEKKKKPRVSSRKQRDLNIFSHEKSFNFIGKAGTSDEALLSIEEEDESSDGLL